MYQAFKEVLSELWDFARGRDIQSVGKPTVQLSPVIKAADKNLDPVLVVPPVQPIVGSRVAYVTADAAHCLVRPVKTFDGSVGMFSYAQKVYVDTIEGSFAHVQTEQLAGWVESALLTDTPSVIYPEFKAQEVYGVSHVDTLKVRRLSRDGLLGAVVHSPLQGLEYVLYVLSKEQVSIDWGYQRPRSAGSWQSLLRGKMGVVMSTEPKTGSVLEVAADKSSTFLAYVEAVLPDLSIRVSSVGRIHPGEYLNEEFSQVQWRPWKPVFISFN